MELLHQHKPIVYSASTICRSEISVLSVFRN